MTTKLSPASRWLLLELLRRSPLGIGACVALHAPTLAEQPKMAQMNGLLRRGWAHEPANGVYFITVAGRMAATELF